MKTIRFLLIGAGNVGRRFLELITLKRDSLCNRLGLDLVLVAWPIGLAWPSARPASILDT